MTRKQQKPIRPMHSKKTGALILALLVAFMIGGSIWFYLGWQESETIKEYETQWRLMTCEEMKKDLKENYEFWKVTALNDKGCS